MTHLKRTVLSESGRTQRFQFFLHHIFRGRPKASVAQHQGAALWKNDRAVSTSFMCFRGGCHEEIDLLEQTMFPVSPSIRYPSLYSSAASSSPLPLSVSLTPFFYLFTINGCQIKHIWRPATWQIPLTRGHAQNRCWLKKLTVIPKKVCLNQCMSWPLQQKREAVPPTGSLCKLWSQNSDLHSTSRTFFL